MSNAEGRWRRLWPHLRALFILVHVVSLLVMALPYSARMSDSAHWQAPAQQDKFESWSQVLGVNKDELQESVWRLTQSYLEVRTAIARPFWVAADYTGARQKWTMFAHPKAVTGSFKIEVERDSTWQLVFGSRDLGGDWNRWKFEHNRVRKLFGVLATKPHQPAYNEFTRWIVKQLALDFPRATRARITLLSWKLLPAERLRAGHSPTLGRARYQEFTLQEYR